MKILVDQQQYHEDSVPVPALPLARDALVLRQPVALLPSHASVPRLVQQAEDVVLVGLASGLEVVVVSLLIVSWSVSVGVSCVAALPDWEFLLAGVSRLMKTSSLNGRALRDVIGS
jgi:hypothetical protein